MKPIDIAIGNNTMSVNSEDFVNGYQAGSLACTLDCRHFTSDRHMITNDEITSIMMEKLEDTGCKEQYSIGYCVGWVATFATKANST